MNPIDKFDKKGDKFNERIIKFARGALYNIKRTYGLNNAELAEIFHGTESDMDEFLREDWDGHEIGTHFLSRIYLLSDGEFNFALIDEDSDNPDYDRKKKIKELVEYVLTDRHKRLIDSLLNEIDIKNDDELAVFVDLFKAFKDNQDA